MTRSEEWREVVGYEGFYAVSSKGRIKSLDRYKKGPYGSVEFWKGKIIKPKKEKNGYLRVPLSKHGIYTLCLVHRLVAKAFLSNEDNLPCVNHKDENTCNNNVENLEWCTHKYNTNYGNCIAKISKKNSKKVSMLSIDGSFERDFSSSKEAQRITGIKAGNIRSCCIGLRNKAGGKKWKWAE